MSFAVWRSRPPFSESQLDPGELIYFRALDGSWPRFDPDTSQVPAGALFVVTNEGVPLQARVDALLAPIPPIDLSNLDNLDRVLRAMELVMRDYANALKQEVRGLAVLLVSKGTITSAEATGLLAYNGSGAGNAKTIADLKADFTAKYNSLT